MKKLTKLLLNTDVYKTGHKTLYPKNIKLVFSNFTPRSGNWAGNGGNIGGVIATGMRYVWNKITSQIIAAVNELKTEKQISEVLKEYEDIIKTIIGIDSFSVEHIQNLISYIKQFQKIPIEFRAVEEQSFVPYKTPVLTLHNTDDNFAWLVNYLETWISSELWPIITASTRAHIIKQKLLRYATETGVDTEFVDFQAHDFSFRGDMGSEAAKLVGIGHLTHFNGSDNLPAIMEMGKGNSVIATEHSIMSSGTEKGEFDTYKRLIKNNPKGILSIVSDTWNIYNVCNSILPALKKQIMKRQGQLVIRPDSGDALEVLLGGAELKHPKAKAKDKKLAKIGLFKIIEKHFGYTLNDKGFKVLPISFLWGDGITFDNIDRIYKALMAEGYASSNVAIGVGSYMYQLVTRDTYGFAIKATYVEIGKKKLSITKDPVTDSGVKKSATGLLAIIDGRLIENATWEQIQSPKNELQKI